MVYTSSLPVSGFKRYVKFKPVLKIPHEFIEKPIVTKAKQINIQFLGEFKIHVINKILE